MGKIKYKNRLDWKKAEPQAYAAAYTKGMLIDICKKFGWDLPEESKKTKPNGYWTKENVLAEARKYKTRSEWFKYSATSIQIARHKGWYDECITHMIETKKPTGYWTKENILVEAKKYKSRIEWRKNSPTSIMLAQRNKLMDECTSHMVITTKPAGYWQIKENVLAEARKYKTRGEWGTGKNGHSASYDAAKKNGWFEEATAHMVEGCTPAGYWSKERLIENALKYEHFGDWLKHDKKAYAASKKNGFWDECTKHMTYKGIPNGYWQIKENVLAEARKYKTRSEFSKNSSGAYNSACLNGWYEEAIAHTDIICTPSGYWTKELVLAEAMKYNSNSEWAKNNDKSYHAARRNGWLDECRQHMDDSVKLPGFWTIKENVLAEARKYDTRSEWVKGSSGSVKGATRNGWFEEATSHMSQIQKTAGYWTKEKCKEEALKYNSPKEWRSKSAGSLGAATKNGWLDECYAHMNVPTKKNYWQIKENVLAEAKKYTSRSEFSKNSSGAYGAAKKYGFYKEATSHMNFLVRPNGTWTKELLLEEAKKWNTISEWSKYGEGISRAKPLGCYEECVAHMKRVTKPMGYWQIKENVLAEAKKYKSKVEWQAKSNGSMKSARQFGWIEEACKHMNKLS